VVVVDADHLIELHITAQVDAGSLVKVGRVGGAGGSGHKSGTGHEKAFTDRTSREA
jgi:hypothetical protein